MPQHVVRTRRLFHKSRLEARKLFHVHDGLGHGPDLSGVDPYHVAAVVADDVAGDGEAARVGREGDADFDFEVYVTFEERFSQQKFHFLFAVAEPAGRFGVAGTARLFSASWSHWALPASLHSISMASSGVMASVM